ncbi:ABC transporter [Paraflavitalea soli]|uniref:ABC transporter n=1 Tax=Paraflavitalea soli TaxID=2315862 RepID=A0A3B7MIY1_9BACT|nr:Gldg family protein [Paraflavitalea soli]AXY73110.1 ABC transporter [Paraflavitalea soli]
MKTVFNIARAELQTLFYSPVAWLIIIIFTFQVSMGFSSQYESWVRYLEQGYKSSGISLDIFANQQGGVLTNVLGYLYLYIPLLTMGLMSREFASGSIKLLYSSPITNAQIILGKYLSMLIYAFILVAILLVYVLTSWSTIRDFELKAVLMGILGIYMLITAYAAIGLFMSSFTSYQVVAAMGTLAVLAALNYVGSLWQDIEFVRDITYWLTISGRAGGFLLGLFSSEDFLYFVIVMLLFLSLTIIRLNAVRQQTRWTASVWKYVGVISIALLLGYATSRPMLMKYYDVTSTKFNTLTPNSQEVIKKLKGGLTITTYTNIWDDQNLYIAYPRAVLADIYRFRQYVRFKPEIKLKYVYYADTTNNPGLAKRFPKLNNKERLQKMLELYGMKESMLTPVEEVRKKVDLSPEGYKFVRVIERESGEKTFLRIFDDQMIFPSEAEITAALKRLAMPLPKIGFVSGHGERDNHKEGDRNYNRFADEKPFRYSVINQGFNVADVVLTRAIPDDINIIVIADMRTALMPDEKVNLDKYVARGGNLFIAGEAKRQQAMDDLVAPFGVRFAPGVLVKKNDNFVANFTIARATPQAGSLSYVFGSMHKAKRVVTMPSAVGLEYTTDKGFAVTPLLTSDSLSWNEMETTDFIDDSVSLNPAIGEVQKAYPTAMALSRKVSSRTQKIVILGDADCISNGEISITRNNIPAVNYSILTGAFFWLSDNEVPIDVRRPDSTDDKISADKDGAFRIKVLLTWVFPGILAICAIVLWIRRRGR